MPKSKYVTKNLVKIINAYTDATPVPIFKEVCFLNNWSYDSMKRIQRERPEVKEAVQHLLDKKEMALERGLLNGTLDSKGCIFSLKQLGWSNREQVSASVAVDIEDLQPLADLLARGTKE